MLEVFELYGTQEQCEDVVHAWRWPQDLVCPSCSATLCCELRRHSRLYFQCGTCRYQCSLNSGTIFDATTLALPKRLVAIHLMAPAKTGVSAPKLMRHLRVSWPTASLIKHKLMQVMLLREERRQLTGSIGHLGWG
jgi:hypothetical protein